MGGMGNQLFQWALGLSLAQTRQVAYSAPRLGSGNHRQFALGHLGVSAGHGFAGQRIFENGLRFHPEILDVQGDVTLTGYWQSEKYFLPVADDIRRRFRGAGSSAQLAAIQAEPNSVFLHVRRTDYLDAGSLKFHGVLNLNYYGGAMNRIEALVPNAKFFVFSDDPAWCRTEFFQGDNVTVIETGSAQEDLFLMSHCRHGITANSTFSWWGAWLNPQQENRIVIAPSTWFAAPQPQAEAADIVPERWTKL